MPKFSELSEIRLKTCDDRLQRVFNTVIRRYDCIILQGHRTALQHQDYMERGATKVPYELSKHSTKPSLAVDVAPYPIPEKWGDKDWKERARFYALAYYVLATADYLGVRLRWGGDWDGDHRFNDQTFDDLVHFEIIEPVT